MPSMTQPKETCFAYLIAQIEATLILLDEVFTCEKVCSEMITLGNCEHIYRLRKYFDKKLTELIVFIKVIVKLKQIY